MHIEFSGSNIEVTNSLRSYFERKIERALLHSGNFVHSVRANLSYETHGEKHTAEVIVFLKNKKTVRNQVQSEDMYASIDIACANIERKLRKHKEKISDKKFRAIKNNKRNLAA